VGAVTTAYAVAFFAVAILLAATLPSFAGFHTVTVYGGSMGKAMPAGSVAVTRPVDAADLEVGDVIAIGGHEGGLPILHRIVAIEEVQGGRLVTTRGDANQTNDRLPITVSGKGDRLVYHIPWIGYFLAFSRSQLGLALLVGVPAAAWALQELLIVLKAIKKRLGRARGERNASDMASRGERGAVLVGRLQGIIASAKPAPVRNQPAAERKPWLPYVFIPIGPEQPAGERSTAPPVLSEGRIRATFIGVAGLSASRPAT
jgi:signal peptidase